MAAAVLFMWVVNFKRLGDPRGLSGSGTVQFTLDTEEESEYPLACSHNQDPPSVLFTLTAVGIRHDAA